MSSFTLPKSEPACTVHLTRDLKQDQLLSFIPFKTWISTLQRSLGQQQKTDHTFHDAPYKLRNINVQSVDFFGGGRIGFIKLKAEISNDQGEKLPGSVFLRGGSVAMMLILQSDEAPKDSEEDKHVLMTLQPRIPAGSLAFPELPAGMLDDSGSFSGGAAKEIEEETGLRVEERDLIDMTALALADESSTSGEDLQKAVYPSAGGSDEFIPIFLYQKRISKTQLQDFQGRLTGLRDHGEKITLNVVPLRDLWRHGARDAKTLSAWALYENLRREGKI